MKPVICPLCGGNCDEPTSETVQDAIRNAGGVKSAEDVPGGRFVVFGNGKSLRIGNWCNACDAEDILTLLGRG